MSEKYNKYCKKDIIRYAEDAKDKTFSELYDISELDTEKDKGIVGNSFQSIYFGIPVNNDSRPDFKEVGLELKVFGYVQATPNLYKADQRLALTKINFFENEKLENSHLYHKCKDMLFVIYHYVQSKETTEDSKNSNKERLNSKIEFVREYEMDKIVKKDFTQIKKDYEIIINKIISGKANELSEGDTELLAAAPTGKGNGEMVLAPGNIKAKPRRFALKQSYMTYLINNYIKRELDFNKPLKKINSNNDIEFKRSKTLEDYLKKKEKSCIDKSAKKMIQAYNRKNPSQAIRTSSYNAYHQLSWKKIFDLPNKCPPYFQMTNTTIKTICIDKNLKIREEISFPSFTFDETFVNSEWQDTEAYNYFNEQRFILSVFKEEDKGYVYKGHIILRLTPEIIDEKIKPIWEKAKSIIENGMKFEIALTYEGNPIHYNDLPGVLYSNENKCISHIRPHSNKSTYKIKSNHIITKDEKSKKFVQEHTKEDGFYYWNEDLLSSTGDILPNGDYMTKQCFWFNKTFVKDFIIKEHPEWFD